MAAVTQKLTSLPHELLLRIVAYLPYMSQVSLAWADKSLYDALRVTVHQQTRQVREAWRVVNMDGYAGSRRLPLDLYQVVRALLDGDVNPIFVKKLICGENLYNQLNRSFDEGRSDLERAIISLPWLRNDVNKDTYLDNLVRCDQHSMFTLLLMFFSELQHIELPMDFAKGLGIIDIVSISRYIAKTHSSTTTIITDNHVPLHKLEYALVGAENGEYGCALRDLYLLFPLPSLRILITFVCNSDEDRAPLEEYPKGHPQSKLQLISFECCAITTTDLETLVQALGMPCTIYHTWEACYSGLYGDESIEWTSCTLDGEIEQDTGLLKPESRTLTIVRDSDDTQEVVDEDRRRMDKVLQPIWNRYGEGFGYDHSSSV